VAFNASALSDELFEAELFGHARGAFTGAVAAREGYAAEARGGTLFIDELADLSSRGQAKLLRLVQEGEYRRVGETELRQADLRIVSAANKRLAERVAAGLFREDLMYRLIPVTLELPPLRERGDDLLALARHFVRAACARAGRDVPALPADVARALSRYPWPGNIRELENEIIRLVALAGAGPLRVEDLSARLRAAGAAGHAARPGSLREAQAAFERDFVARSLGRHGGCRVRAAEELGITRQALLEKTKRLGL
jgi:DNA-binding NtrC family response regulator